MKGGIFFLPSSFDREGYPALLLVDISHDPSHVNACDLTKYEQGGFINITANSWIIYRNIFMIVIL